jgi:hypothetical protein
LEKEARAIQREESALKCDDDVDAAALAAGALDLLCE